MPGYRLVNKKFENFKADFDTLVAYYKEKYGMGEKRNWAEYEESYAKRLQSAIKEIRPITEKANALLLKNLKIIGRPVEVSYVDKTIILLVKDIVGFGNRRMSNFMSIFSPFTGICMSYKTVERAYSTLIISMMIHNMFEVTIRRKNIKHVDVTGDATGYSFTVMKHYSMDVKKENGKERAYAYSFAFMDLDTKMYIGYGTGMRSEKEAFDDAKCMIDTMGITIDSTRLDKYYTHQSIVKEFGTETKIYILPKANTTIHGSKKWHEIWRSIMYDTMSFLREYYKRENSESGFAADKKSNGYEVPQRRDDRIRTSLMCKGLWHNLLLVGKS